MTSTHDESHALTDYDFIVVGSGAGGGPLACNLARNHYKVLLIEAGGEKVPDNVEIPAFHAVTTEDPLISWEYFVRHYASLSQSKLDSKFVAERDGIFYPRASGIGG